MLQNQSTTRLQSLQITSIGPCWQENVPAADSAICLTTINLFMQHGLTVSVSTAQTIFQNRLPLLLQRYAPNIHGQLIAEAGATNVRKLIPAADMPGFLQAYNNGITEVFVSSSFWYFPNERLLRIDPFLSISLPPLLPWLVSLALPCNNKTWLLTRRKTILGVEARMLNR